MNTENLRNTCGADSPFSGDQRLVQLGGYLRDARTKGYKETLREFSCRLNVSVNTVRSMESGEPGVAIGTWFQAMELMLVVTDVLDAARPDALLLAAQLPRTLGQA